MAKRIGEILVEKKLLTPEELNRALLEHKKTGEFLGSALIKMGYISEEKLLQSLAEQLNIPFVNLKHTTIDQAVIKSVPARLVQHYKVMPIGWEHDVLTIALSDPLHMWPLEDIRLHLGCEVQAPRWKPDWRRAPHSRCCVETPADSCPLLASSRCWVLHCDGCVRIHRI